MPRVSPRSTNLTPIDRRTACSPMTEDELWGAAHIGEAIVFTCISDGRNSGRAIIVNLPARLDNSVGDEALRAWLKQPRESVLCHNGLSRRSPRL